MVGRVDGRKVDMAGRPLGAACIRGGVGMLWCPGAWPELNFFRMELPWSRSQSNLARHHGKAAVRWRQ